MADTTTKTIDPNDSLRQKEITFAGKPKQSIARQGTAAQTDFKGIDMSQFNPAEAGGKENVFNRTAARASGGRRLDFNIDPRSVMADAMAAFQAQLPGMNQDFADQSEQLAKGTAAMGRTGSGLFNRDTGFISDRARATREGMLGNLSFQGAQSDQGADLQAQMTRQNLLNSQEGRMSQASMANAQMQNQAQLAQAQNALQSMMQNQSLGAQAGMFNAGAQNDMQRFNLGNDLQNQMFNIGNDIQNSQFGANFQAQQQARQDAMAQQAQQNLFQQMQMMGQFGFGQDPTGAGLGAAGGIGNTGQQFGNQAGQANAGLGAAAAGATQLWDMMYGGGQPRPQPQASQPGTIGIGQNQVDDFMGRF